MADQTLKILPYIIKLFLATLCMVISMVFFLASINAAMAKSNSQPIKNVVVTDDVITLGDVFTNIDETNADYVLAPAPKPNATLTWNARTLNRIARAFRLSWSAQATDQIEIRRLAAIVTKDMMSDVLVDALRAEGLKGDFDLDFVGSNSEIILPHDIDLSVTVEKLSYNASRRTFSAILKTPDGRLQQVTGMAHAMIDIPVLKTPARRGDFITKNMVTTLSVRESDIQDDYVILKNDLVGMSPRRVMSANTPILIQELIKPVMVKRGDLVTMQLHNGPIIITALAKAMETGAKGDIIRLMNVDSKRSLEAQVTGIREAIVLN